LIEKKHQVNVVNNDVEAGELIQKLIPAGATIYTAGSTTLNKIGFVDYMKGEIPYTNLKSAIFEERQVFKIELFFFFSFKKIRIKIDPNNQSFSEKASPHSMQ
jgi:hypothetical protein